MTGLEVLGLAGGYAHATGDISLPPAGRAGVGVSGKTRHWR